MDNLNYYKTTNLENGSNWSSRTKKMKNNVSDQRQNSDPTSKLSTFGIGKRAKFEIADNEPFTFRDLFQYATITDLILTTTGVLTAIVASVTQPLSLKYLGDMLEQFLRFGIVLFISCDYPSLNSTNSSDAIKINMLPKIEELDPEVIKSDFLSSCNSIVVKLSILGLAQIFLQYLMVTLTSLSAERQAHRIRIRFMRAILRQDMAWFDKQEKGDFASKTVTDLRLIQEGIGDKLAMATYFTFAPLLMIATALAFGWKLTLVIISGMPLYVLVSGVISKIQSKYAREELTALGKAGLIAEEVISGIRTVLAFSGEKKESERYNCNLATAKSSSNMRSFCTGLGSCILWLGLYLTYAVAFWYGSHMVIEDRCSKNGLQPSSLLTIFLCVMMSALNISNLPSYLEAFSLARGAASNVFSIIQRIPMIDSLSDAGIVPSEFNAHVVLRNVQFNYVSRPNVPVLRGLTLEMKPGETIALVGESGSGKSTVVQLLLRLHDVCKGDIWIDGINIKELNLGWLRENIGVVDQEPVLFEGTIMENIQLGNRLANRYDVLKAAKESNAHQFIKYLPQGYDTLVGQRGTQLSGGQKQRIAIARALIRNPKLLLLDEATSALDSESEALVQNALDKARAGRTTLIIAHRLSTIHNADHIIYLSNGVVIEEGKHTALMERKGKYFDMIRTQLGELKPDLHHPPGFHSSKRRHSSVYEFPEKHLNEKSLLANKEEDSKNASNIRLLLAMASECHLVMLGTVCSVIMGLSYPASALVFGNVIDAISIADVRKAYQEESKNAVYFVIFGIFTGLTAFFQVFLFSMAGARLTLKLRKKAFKALLRQELSWFENPKNSTGALCSRLSSDTANIQAATGARISSLFEATATLTMSLGIAFYYSRELGYIVLPFAPISVILTHLYVMVYNGRLTKEMAAGENSTKIAIEAIENLRTVQALHEEESFLNKYADQLETLHKDYWKKCHIQGLLFGLCQCIPFYAYVAVMKYGSFIVADNEIAPADLYKISQGVVMGTLMYAQSVIFAPDYKKAASAASRIFKLLDRKPKRNYGTDQQLLKGNESLSIEFRNVRFSYSNRPEIDVLKNLGFRVDPGETLALIGTSGCGKSTCVNLIAGFYDWTEGQIMVNETNISAMNLDLLRSKMGIVSQEPSLFSYSIAGNIAYGDNSREVPMSEIVDSAMKANIHSFVSSLPFGYDTILGERGTQLSGGQKQRVAIARALVRNPAILLLDEATSALDAESERVVLSALNDAREGRTCIMVAHNLASISNADKIAVIMDGAVIETGTHNELLNAKGVYHRLHAFQTK